MAPGAAPGIRSPRAASAREGVSLSAFSLQAIVLWGGQALVGRTRPIVRRCEGESGDGDERCSAPMGLAARRSFMAGHTATGVTVAGLTCLHHSRIPLYGGWGDSAACAATVVAAFVKRLRARGDREPLPYGAVIRRRVGVLSGWVLPSALHYGFGWGTAAEPEVGTAPAFRAMVMPYWRRDQLGAVLGGAF